MAKKELTAIEFKLVCEKLMFLDGRRFLDFGLSFLRPVNGGLFRRF